MKKVLIISYNFYKKESALRINGLTKYLKEFGWIPTVITSNYKNYPSINLVYGSNVIAINHENSLDYWKQKFGYIPNVTLNEQIGKKKPNNKFFQIILNFLTEIIAFPDESGNWRFFSIIELKSLLAETQYDAIISSFSPPTPHIIGGFIKEKYDIPWIADFRDLWTQHHNYSFTHIRKFFETRLEKQIISNANAITTVSYPLVEKLHRIHKNKSIFSIPNGFDPDTLKYNDQIDPNFLITYTGRIYQKKQNPFPLFYKINQLTKNGLIKREKLKIEIYGPYENRWIYQEKYFNEINDIVTLHDQVPRDIAIQKQRKSQMLLLLTWNDPSESGIYTGKIFEYLAARRPILSIGSTNGGVVKELLDQTHAGVHVSTEKDLIEYLMKAYYEYIEYGEVQYHGIEEEIMKYSHREMARKFAVILDQISVNL